MQADVGSPEPDPWYQAPALVRPGTTTTRLPGARSLAPAGWSRAPRLALPARTYQALRWSNLRTNAAARDQAVAGLLKRDLAGAMRNAWLDQELADGGDRRTRVQTPLLVAGAGDAPVRVFILGDTGDASEAQFAVARHLEGRARSPGVALDTPTVSAVMIESDIVYPAGSYNEYQAKFYDAYEALLEMGIPIYAVPGNHDWNDGSLAGFMAAFCGATSQPDAVDLARRTAAGSPLRRWVAQRSWHRGSPTELPALRSPAGQAPRQPAPYVALDVGGVLFIGIDTGFDGPLDSEQATWLVEVAEAAAGTPKILFTGKPLIVDGHRDPCAFLPPAGSGDPAVRGASGTAYRSVDDVVARAENGFAAVVGGDVHNYQRYLARIKGSSGENTIPYLVSGGGGVFVGQTFWLPRISIDDTTPNGQVRCDEAETVLFPQRAHSRLFVDAITRKSLRRVRFTLFLALAMAGVLALALTAVHANWMVGVSILMIAVAVNISAHPIDRDGRFWVVGFAAAGIILAVFAVDRGLEVLGHMAGLTATRVAIAAAYGAGTALLLTPGPEHRFRGRVGGAFIVAGSLASLDAGFPVGTRAVWPILFVLAVIAVVLAAASRWAYPRITVEGAFGEVQKVVDDEESPWLRIKRASTGWLVKRQRLLSSLCETFSDGRLTETTRLPGAPEGMPPRPYVPMYRSFLEIEYQRDPGTRNWSFHFTSFAVTGAQTLDTTPGAGPPIIVDAFDVLWTPAGNTVTTTAQSFGGAETGPGTSVGGGGHA